MPDIACPSCGHQTEGPFCSQCGARVAAPVTCAACEAPLPSGGRFCNQCGAPAGSVAPAAPATAAATTPAAPARAASTLPWVVAAFAVLALVIALIFPRPDSSAAPAEGMATGPATAGPTSEFGDARSVDLASMTPRERADNLFNRVMESVSASDTTQARFFLPMALAAYDEVPDLDADGHYHVAVLHLSGGDAAAARARADSILAGAPQHLFGLFTAAQAEQALGNADAARNFYRQFNESFDAEVALGRQEYAEHQGVMPMMQQEARSALGQ